MRGGEFVGTFQTLVNPGRAIPAQISVLTGLTDALVATAPRIEAVLPSLLTFLGDSVFVGHNVRFDLGFLQAALRRDHRPDWQGVVVDTVALARRLLRDEVPNCRLGTLASRLRLDHQPTHRALDDALATTDLLHLLIERATGLGVLGLDDLVALGKLGGHPNAAKLRMTADLPRSPGVYLFRGAGGELLYVGKATNVRQRVRSYFGSDDRRKVGPMLRETQSIEHIPLPDPLTAEIVEARLIGRALPRYNRRGTTATKYCYVRLDADAAWPRLSIVKRAAASGVHLGPLPSRRMASLVVDAIHTALPLRRCTKRLGRNHQPELDTAVCSAAQLGVAHCPCSGTADPGAYAAAVEQAVRAMRGDAVFVTDRLRERMARLAAERRFEEAATARDRLSAYLGAVKRTALLDALVTAGRVEVRSGEITWLIDGGRLVDVLTADTLTAAIPVAPGEPLAPGGSVPSDAADELLVLARHLDRNAHRIEVASSGPWRFPIAVADEIEPLTRAA